MVLTSRKKKTLRQDAHHLKPVVMIGSKGLSETVVNELDIALEAHELIKVKINDHDRDAIKAMIPEICLQTRAEHVQTMGHTVTIWRKVHKKS
jgi:RNA-binding protein